MSRKKLQSILLLFSLIMLSGVFCPIAFGQERGKATMTQVSTDSYSPELYSDKLNLQISLVNLPGAETAGSSYQVSYQLYFIPEKDFQSFVQKNGGRIEAGQEPSPQSFSNKILLTSGNFTKNNLQNISERTIGKNDISFKAKIPAESQTMIGKLVSFYSVRIYDAKLRKNALRSGIFIASPFITENGGKAPRRTVFLNFLLNDDGRLFASQWARDKNDTSWTQR